ncbi:MAG: HAMP domain-containing histidine kinase [Candidatus Kapabacteria bacterium]|nr:HAMP domain-containing histidine kinase [Candidatus Kapabacteria bacterium]
MIAEVHQIEELYEELKRLKREVNYLKKERDSRKKIEESLRLSEIRFKELNSQKDKFFSIIAHEIRSPFMGFLGLTKMLALKIDEFSKDEIKEIAIALNESAKRIFKLFENIIDWSRIQRGLVQLKKSCFCLKDAVDESIEMLNIIANQKAISIINLVDDNIKVLADKETIVTVISNLISNGIKFTKEGGFVKIAAFDLDEDFIELSVIDNGIGIEDETIKNLFKLDSLQSTFGTNYERGTGLGLIISKEFTELNGGKISVNSKVGKGSTFSITIPKANNQN